MAKLLNIVTLIHDLGRVHPDKLLASRGYRIYSVGVYVGIYIVSEEGILMLGIYHTKTDWLNVE